MKDIDTKYKLIPFTEVEDMARKIAVRWAGGAKMDWIGDKHKLASDIMNYAKLKIIEFNNWRHSEGFGNASAFTSEQLYELFIQQKTKAIKDDAAALNPTTKTS